MGQGRAEMEKPRRRSALSRRTFLLEPITRRAHVTNDSKTASPSRSEEIIVGPGSNETQDKYREKGTDGVLLLESLRRPVLLFVFPATN